MATNIKVGDRFILDIKRLGINGEGIGFYNHLAIFVEGAIPGEGHNVEVTKVMDKMAFAKSLELKHYNEFRKTPECSHYNDCGGCNTMHITENKMAELKRDILIESINRYTTRVSRGHSPRKSRWACRGLSWRRDLTAPRVLLCPD